MTRFSAWAQVVVIFLVPVGVAPAVMISEDAGKLVSTDAAERSEKAHALVKSQKVLRKNMLSAVVHYVQLESDGHKQDVPATRTPGIGRELIALLPNSAMGDAAKAIAKRPDMAAAPLLIDRILGSPESTRKYAVSVLRRTATQSKDQAYRDRANALADQIEAGDTK